VRWGILTVVAVVAVIVIVMKVWAARSKKVNRGESIKPLVAVPEASIRGVNRSFDNALLVVRSGVGLHGSVSIDY
jgi:hypothetical protein